MKSNDLIRPMRDIDVRHGDFRRVDLNLLVAFDALMAERSVARAAERVFLGQPAMSHALARLREMLGDPLFIRTGNRMAPTAAALTLAPRVHAWLATADAFLFDPARFDAARAEGTVHVGIPDGLEALLFPPLVAALRRDAPGVTVRATSVAQDRTLAALDAEQIDLAVGPAIPSLREWHGQTVLLESGFDVLYSRRQLQLPSPLSLEVLAAQDHVAYSYRSDAAGLVDSLFDARGLVRRVVAVSAGLVAIGRIVAEAPLVSVQPRLYAPLYRALAGAGSDLAVEPLADEGLRFAVGMVWHRRNDHHALQSHVRGLVERLMPRP